MDIYLPDGNGLDILRGLDIDAFVLSAASDPSSVRKAMRRGALGYLIKPFSEKQLAEKLRGYARYRRLLARNPHWTRRSWNVPCVSCTPQMRRLPKPEL